MAKLSHKDKIAIVRDALISKPRYWAYGWNRALIKFFRDKFEVNMSDKVMSELKDSTLKQMETDKNILISREKLIEMHTRIVEESTNAIDKARSLIEIGKLEGLYEEKIKVNRGIADLSEEELLKLKEGLKE